MRFRPVLLRPSALATLVALVAPIASIAPSVRAQGVPLVGQTTRDCLALADLDAAGGELYGIKVTTNDPTPDLLFDATATGGDDVGAVLSGTVWQVDAAWTFTSNPMSRATIVITMPGEVLVETSDFVATDLGIAQPQPVGVLAAGAPGVTATSWGYEVSFRPLRQQTPSDGIDCSVAGNPGIAFRPIIGYAVYRLQGTGNPPLPQFRTAGYVGFLDMRTFQMTTADATGLGCSDLATGDEVRLVNPNGILDDGDEIVIFSDRKRTPSGRLRANAPDPLQSHLYRLQPIVQGNPAYFDSNTRTISSSLSLITSSDRDASGTKESIDLLNDGRFEFIDPGRHGMGLTWSGEILSSPLPGQGTPGPIPTDPDGDGIPSADELLLALDPLVSNSGSDTDGDGPSDLLEAEAGSLPALADADGSGERDGREMFYGRSPRNTCDDVVITGRVLGDVAPLITGDGVVTVADVVRMLRMSVGLATPTPQDMVLADLAPAELSNGATAPPTWRRHGNPDGLGQHPYGRQEHGDGTIDVADVVLALRISVGLITVVD